MGNETNITPENINDFPVFAWNKAYKLDFVKDNYFIWAEKSYFEEVYFYYDFFMCSNEIYIIDDMLYYYRQRENSIMSRDDIELQRCKDLYKILSSLYNMIDIKGYNPMFKDSLIRYGRKFNYTYRNKPLHQEVTTLLNNFYNTHNIDPNYWQ